MLRGEFGGVAAVGRRDIGVVVVVVRTAGAPAVDDAAIPGVVVGRGPVLVGIFAIVFVVVARAAATAIHFVPGCPIDPAGSVVALVDIHVLGKGNDRHVDIRAVGGGILELRQQLVGCVLQRGHLAVVGHRARVVERERDTQTAVAPLHRRGAADVQAREAHQLHERRVHRARHVHRGTRRVGAAVINGGADQTEDRNRSNPEDDSDVAGVICAQCVSVAPDSIYRAARPVGAAAGKRCERRHLTQSPLLIAMQLARYALRISSIRSENGLNWRYV